MIHEIHYAIFRHFPEIECKTVWEEHTPEETAKDDEALQVHFLRVQNASGIVPNRVAAAEQVHGNRVKPAVAPGVYPECDGLVSECTNLYLQIRTADCAAVMVYDPKQKVIANWHAGWRGVRSDIIGKGLHLLRQKWGCLPEHLRVAVSPFIQECCYQVGEEFRRYFSRRYLTEHKDGIHLNLNLAITDQLLSAGVRAEHLEVSRRCTGCDAEHLPSFRRTGTGNRLLNVIKIKEV